MPELYACLLQNRNIEFKIENMVFREDEFCFILASLL
jgi:hypothetical protein